MTTVLPQTLPGRTIGSDRTTLLAVPEVRWASAATALFVLGLLVQLSPAPTWMYWTLYLACYITGGWEPALEGIRALRNRALDVDLLMIVAAIGAAAISKHFNFGKLRPRAVLSRTIALAIVGTININPMPSDSMMSSVSWASKWSIITLQPPANSVGKY